MVKLLVLLAVLSCLTAGCATSRSVPPSGRRADLPQFEFPGLKGRTLRIEVLDHRGDRENSDLWIERLRTDITNALTAAGVAVSPDAPATLEVRINRLRSDFERASWTACARLTTNLDLRSENRGRTEFPVETCVNKANVSGPGTADKALRQVYQDALTEVLSTLDSRAR